MSNPRPLVHHGTANGKWNGGLTINCDGYLRITAGVLRGRYVHRLVLEAKLGRPLAKDEEAHHLNGDRLDCRPENLAVLKVQEHRAYLYGTRKKEAQGCQDLTN